MHVALQPEASAARSTVVVHRADDLLRIRERGVNLCVWRRSMPVELEQFVNAWVLPATRKCVVTGHSQAPRVDELLQDLPRAAGYERLRNDILELVQLHGRLIGAGTITLKLESFGDNLCERFHFDWVPLRLICSYSGPGTEWLDNADVERSKLGPGSRGLPDEQSGLLRSASAIQQMTRFDVALMKGELWPGNQGNGLVHRSPKIRDAGLRRVLFKIDGGEASARPQGPPISGGRDRPRLV